MAGHYRTIVADPPWSFASAVGPLLIARMRETAGSYGGALHVIAGVMAVSILLPIVVRPFCRRGGVLCREPITS